MIYVVKFSYGNPEIASIEVVKETEKTVTVTGQKNLLGHMYLPNRLNKQDYAIFDSYNDACEHLINLLFKYQDNLLAKVKEADGYITSLTKGLEE